MTKSILRFRLVIKHLIFFLILFLTFLSYFPFSEEALSVETSSETPSFKIITSSVINITKNSDFRKWSSTGEGTKHNPFVIEGKSIDANLEKNRFCIHISNTNAFFIIQDCNLSSGYNAIKLNNVSNGKIQRLYFNLFSYPLIVINSSAIQILNSFFDGGDACMIINESKDNQIVNNTLNRFDTGIVVGRGSSMILIGSNIITSSNDFAIHLLSGSTHNNVTENHILESRGSGIALCDTSNNHFFQNRIIESKKDGVILKNSTSNIFSSNFIVKNGNTGSECNAGINLKENSINNSIEYNVISYNLFFGIESRSRNNIIQNNHLDHNGETGVKIAFTRNNIVRNNNISFNSIGLSLENSSFQSIIENNFIFNNRYGISIDSKSHSNQVIKNNLIGNQGPGIDISNPSDNSNIVEGNYIDNTEDYRTLDDENEISGFSLIIPLLIFFILGTSRSQGKKNE